MSALVILFITKTQLASDPLSCKLGYVSPSPILHQCLGSGVNVDKSKGTPLLYIVDALELWSLAHIARTIVSAYSKVLARKPSSDAVVAV